MKIEVGKQYWYISHKGLRPHPNEHIENGTIVTVTVVMPGGVMLEGYQYPHKAERLQELMPDLPVYSPTSTDTPDKIKLAFAKQVDAALAAGITIEELIEWMSKRGLTSR